MSVFLEFVFLVGSRRGRPPGGQAVRVWVGGRDAQAVGGREREVREDVQGAFELRAVGGVLFCVSFWSLFFS